jgi:hypothetical protein
MSRKSFHHCLLSNKLILILLINVHNLDHSIDVFLFIYFLRFSWKITEEKEENSIIFASNICQ